LKVAIRIAVSLAYRPIQGNREIEPSLTNLARIRTNHVERVRIERFLAAGASIKVPTVTVIDRNTILCYNIIGNRIPQTNRTSIFEDIDMGKITWHDQKARGPGDVRACLTFQFLEIPGIHAREPLENLRSIITRCVGEPRFRRNPAPPSRRVPEGHWWAGIYFSVGGGVRLAVLVMLDGI
jgi:hypothetical protein